MEQKVNKNWTGASGDVATGARGHGSQGAGVDARRSKTAGRANAQGAAMLAMLRRLARAPATLAPAPDGGGDWMICVAAKAGGEAGAGVSLGGGLAPGPLVSAMLSSGLLEETAGGARRRLALSDAGRAHLARAEAPAQPFAAQHQDIGMAGMTVDGVCAQVAVNHRESPLAWLRRRRSRDGAALIDEAAFVAGERLRADMERAQMTPRMTVDWLRPGRGNGAGPFDLGGSDLAIAARARVRRALDAVGPEFAGLLVDVCGFLKGLEQVERERRWPARAGKVVLGLALGRLASHYGLSSPRGRGAPGA